jgi:hypothetical protein
MITRRPARPGDSGRRMLLSATLAAALLGPGCRMSTEVVNGGDPSRVLFQEEFNDNGNHWFTGTVPESYSFEVANGEYFLKSFNDSGVFAVKSIPIPEDGNFDIKVSLKLRRTEKDLGHGFCWGGRGPENRFCLFISRDRQFTLFKRESGRVSDYIPWTASSLINPDRNTLEIRRRGFTLECIINGGAAGRIPQEKFHGSQMTFATDGIQDISVDQLLILVED